jgi:hypothetical protein
MNVSGLIRIVSILLTAAVAVSFGLFVWDELGSASKNQAQLATPGAVQTVSVRDVHGRLSPEQNSKIRVNIDRVNDAITSPGESIGRKTGQGNPWAMRGLAFIFGILVFLVGLRLLAGWIEMSGPASAKVTPHNPRDGYTAGSR